MMNKILHALRRLHLLEELSNGESFIHRLNPLIKILTTVIFILTVVSFNRYSFFYLLPLLLYPLIISRIAKVPATLLLTAIYFALPFTIFAGLSNLFFAAEIFIGIISLSTLILKSVLTVSASVLLIATTKLQDLFGSLLKIGLPKILLVQILLTFRYIFVLAEEASNMYLAYQLRNTNSRGIALADSGTFIGQLILRSYLRGARIYTAMKCRGF